MDKSILFTPLELKNIVLPGRIVRSATELFCSYPDAHVFSAEFTVFERLSEQPLGMIVSAHTCVSPEGRSNMRQNAIWDDEYIEDTRRIAEAAQKNGVPCVMQIGHGGMKAKGNNGGRPVYTPDNMTVGQIHEVVKAFGEAALRAKKAGMSGVMLHGAHHYLLSQFFYPHYNHRTDAYGGSGANRFRIIAEAIEEIKNVCGSHYPVFIKINGDDEHGSEEYHRDLADALNSVKDALEAAEISGWTSAKGGVPEKPYFIDNIKRLSGEVDLPLIEVGGIRSASDMLGCLEAGASAVSLSRPLLCEPDFPKMIMNTADAVSKCRGCGFCYNPLDHETQIRCPIAGKINNSKEMTAKFYTPEIIHNSFVIKKAYETLWGLVGAQYGMTRIEADVLAFVAINPRCNTARDIVNYRMIAKSHVSKAIDSLIARGFLRGEHDTADRRRVLLIPTDAAAAVIETIRTHQAHFAEQLLEGLSDEEKIRARELFNHVSENAQKMIDTQTSDE